MMIDTRSNRLLELARMMVKQAIMLKRSGLVREARLLAQRAIEINARGHREMRARPARICISC